jgi:hypothetical protein
MVFDRDDELGPGARVEQRALVHRRKRSHVDDARRNPLLFEEGARGPHLAQHDAVGEQRHVLSRREDLGAAHRERLVVRHHGGQRVVAHVHGGSIRDHVRHHRQELHLVRGADHSHLRYSAENADVLDRLMGRAVRFGEDARHAADELHGQPGDADVGADELERAQHEEGRERVDHRDPPSEGEARGRADHGLFGDADVDEARPEDRRQVADSGAILGGHDDQSVVVASEVGEQGLVVHGPLSGRRGGWR